MSTIKPVHYTISLTPDLSSFTFSGLCKIHLETSEPAGEVRLKALELDIESCRLTGGSEEKECRFKLDEKKEELIITLPGMHTGDISLSISYKGLINDKMAGFYRSSYKTGSGDLNSIAVTQFEESDARRAFPCMDHPAYKARFSIEMIIDSQLDAISNEDIDKEETLPGGKKRVLFKTTPIMSTYLLFFGVGTFEKLTDKEDSRVRLYCVPGKIQYGSYGVEFGRKALHYCETYYDIPYPVSKMDLIAVPDFAFGAMENWGAITFRENLLLHYPGITSRGGEYRICEVCAHEIVHMWFGNLVTPTDWKYLWLNESFATLFGYAVVNHYHPEWDMWDHFISGQTAGALERDSLNDTIPIEIPGGEHVVINTSTSPIIYSKGGSILRQLKEYIGDDSFRKGLHHYLKTYAYDNASTREFLKAFEQASGVPVAGLMKTWIEQPGFPLVTVQRDGNSLLVQQRRFTYLDNPADRKNRSGQTWNIPLTIRVGYEDGKFEDIKILFHEKEKHINLDKSFINYKINPGQTGFYRVYYKDIKNLEALKTLIAEKKLSPADRWGCENDLHALVNACIIPFREYLSFLSAYNSEDACLPLTSIANYLYRSFFILSGSWHDPIQKTGLAILETALDRIAYYPGKGESYTTSVLRTQILYDAVFFGSAKTRDFLLQQFHSLCDGREVHPDLLSNTMMAGAFLEPEKAWDVLIRRFTTTESEHDRINILSGLSFFSQKDIIMKALSYVLENVPSRNKYIPITSMVWNRHALPFLWDWYVSHIDELEKFHPIHYERIIASIIPLCGLEREDEVQSFFREYTAKKDTAQQVISLALERLKIHLRIRKENG
ncbi:MAG: M1 family metallopeptidase [Spirochaetales bacterium]|nr:M1 family metallopeptidase [Spirochaetales bacterium]